MIKRYLPTLAAACVLLAACEHTTTISPQRPLEDAPTRIQVDGRDLTLEAYVYRDFMPVSPPGGTGLIAGLRVYTVDGTALPAGITADSVAVQYQAEVWTSAVTTQDGGNRVPSVLAVVARDGPRWPTGSTVDVVLYLHDATGRGYRLGAPDQTIRRTD